MVELKKLREENERLKKRLQETYDHINVTEKVSDLFFVLIFAGAYFLVISFVLSLAKIGINVLISDMPVESASLYIAFYIVSWAVLCVLGLVAAANMIIDIIRDEILSCAKYLGIGWSGFVRAVGTEKVECAKPKSRRGVKPKGKYIPPRDKKGKFVKKKKD